MVTEWRDCPGFPGYQVSDAGQVRSLPGGRRRGGLLRGTVNGKGYRTVVLRSGTRDVRKFVHRLVLEAFVGPRPAGQVTRHLNDQPWDNRLGNLTWGTVSDNALDCVANGGNPETNKTECVNGHPFTPANTFVQSMASGRTRRVCRTCRRRAQDAYKAARRATA